MLRFINDVKQSGKKVDFIAVVMRARITALRFGASIVDAAKAANINVSAHITYNANSSDVTAQVLQLKSANPDAVIFISYTADSILYFKTMKNLDYLPPIIIGDDAGFSDPSFIPNVGDLAQGALDRCSLRCRQARHQQLSRQQIVPRQIQPRS